MREEKFEGTRLTLEMDGTKTVWEVPYTDLSTDQLLEALQGLCVAQTFIAESFVRSCGNFFEEHRYLYEDLKEKEDD